MLWRNSWSITGQTHKNWHQFVKLHVRQSLEIVETRVSHLYGRPSHAVTSNNWEYPRRRFVFSDLTHYCKFQGYCSVVQSNWRLHSFLSPFFRFFFLSSLSSIPLSFSRSNFLRLSFCKTVICRMYVVAAFTAEDFTERRCMLAIEMDTLGLILL